MNGVRSALLFATADRYFSLGVNFLSVATVSRLLTPQEIGLAVVGSAVCALWFRLREFTPLTFIILRKDLILDDIRAAFTISFLLSGAVCLLLMASAGIFGPSLSARRTRNPNPHLSACLLSREYRCADPCTFPARHGFWKSCIDQHDQRSIDGG